MPKEIETEEALGATAGTSGTGEALREDQEDSSRVRPGLKRKMLEQNHEPAGMYNN